MLDAVDICEDIAELSIMDDETAIDEEVSMADEEVSIADEELSIIEDSIPELGIEDDEDCASAPVASAAARAAPTIRSLFI